jgi:hypothetical protein
MAPISSLCARKSPTCYANSTTWNRVIVVVSASNCAPCWTACRPHGGAHDQQATEGKRALVEKLRRDIGFASSQTAAIAACKQAQTQWKTLPRAGRKTEDALWAELRAVIDPVFDKAREQQQAQQSELEAQAAARQAVLDELAALEQCRSRGTASGRQRSGRAASPLGGLASARALPTQARKHAATVVRTMVALPVRRVRPSIRCNAVSNNRWTACVTRNKRWNRHAKNAPPRVCCMRF